MKANTMSGELLSPPSHDEWMELAKTEYERLTSLLTALPEWAWANQTDCTEWDVTAMVAHVLGAAESNASMVETVKQLSKARRWAKQNNRLLVDGLCAVQIRERSHLTPTELVARYRSTWPRALQRRTKMPTVIRKHAKVPGDTPGITEKWEYGYLNDCIYTRDVWMHRIDISRAAGVPVELSVDHDRRIVADLVGEWSRRHGQPFTLVLTGVAGGNFDVGTGGPQIELDAVEFARTLSGRTHGDGLLSVPVPF